MGCWKVMKNFFSREYEKRRLVQMTYNKMNRNLDIKTLVWNSLIRKYPEKITYLENSGIIDENTKTITFKGEFNIASKKEQLNIEITFKGEPQKYKVILIKEPHLKHFFKINNKK